MQPLSQNNQGLGDDTTMFVENEKERSNINATTTEATASASAASKIMIFPGM
jgi:hypothetical protein